MSNLLSSSEKSKFDSRKLENCANNLKVVELKKKYHQRINSANLLEAKIRNASELRSLNFDKGLNDPPKPKQI